MGERSEDERRAVVAEELRRCLDRESGCVVLLALHVGCMASALGVTGRVDPAAPPEAPHG